jgi:hypothetical protein
MIGALQGCSSFTRRARRPTAFLTQGHSVCARRASVRRRARMDMGQSGGRRLDSDVRQLHRRVRPLRGSWGSRQLSSTEHVYPSLRASTVLSAMPSSHDLSYNDVFATTTIVGAPCTPAATATPPSTSTPAPAHVAPSPVEFATPLSHDEEHIDACYDGEPLRYRTMEDLLGDQPVPGLVPATWRGSCTLRAMTVSLGLSQRPRKTRHGMPR